MARHSFSRRIAWPLAVGGVGDAIVGHGRFKEIVGADVLPIEDDAIDEGLFRGILIKQFKPLRIGPPPSAGCDSRVCWDPA